ncbi:hypothetical protein Zmor_007475 [Zophobas morio]|uniref:Protein Abitram n=1 Tax=Zophobas morio TaxID=2755281 RepID=A0AA38IYC2_9CUCU|nr:hypothetical protein Zmor_007475 [Zophobas morio]
MEVEKEESEEIPSTSSNPVEDPGPSQARVETESDDEDIEIPSILDSITQQQIDEFRPFHERYFEKKYCTRFTTDTVNLDTCVRIHTNKISLIYLSEKHSVIQNQQRLQSIDFQVSKKVNRLKNAMFGKGKRGAQLLQPDSILCHLETVDGARYPVHACVYGKLLEINSRVIKEPNFLLDDLNEGFLAIILPDLRRHEENVKSLKSVEEYNT